LLLNGSRRDPISSSAGLLEDRPERQDRAPCAPPIERPLLSQKYLIHDLDFFVKEKFNLRLSIRRGPTKPAPGQRARA
jgi:hypothetical protein